MYDLDSGVISTSRDVVFVETDFPFAHLNDLIVTSTNSLLPSSSRNQDMEDNFLESQPASRSSVTTPVTVLSDHLVSVDTSPAKDVLELTSCPANTISPVADLSAVDLVSPLTPNTPSSLSAAIDTSSTSGSSLPHTQVVTADEHDEPLGKGYRIKNQIHKTP